MTGRAGRKQRRATAPPPDLVRRVVRAALREDVGTGDVTGRCTVARSRTGAGDLIFRDGGVAAGMEVAWTSWRLLDPEARFEAYVRDGDRVRAGTTAARVRGRVRALLAGERTALNFLGRLSGIATLTARFVEQVRGTRTTILDTRKTTPGLRLLEKYAVRVGGGGNHRFCLDDMILVKENHISCAGGVAAALDMVEEKNRKGLPVEIEVTCLAELEEALGRPVDRIMIDNMDPPELREAVRLVKRPGRRGRRPVLEASGRVTLENVREIAETGVDLISVGALTHSPEVLDVSFLLLSDTAS
jgi:nicotinate-nucleotide pyrophosphorylase (carboxylating)